MDESVYIILIWVICLLLVIIVLGIVEAYQFILTSNAIEATIVNPIFCPNNTSNPLCALNPNFTLSIPENANEYSNLISKFVCNLVGCLEYAFLKNQPGTTIQTSNNEKTPTVKLPDNVQGRTAIYYQGRLIGLICTTPSTNAIWVIFRGTQSKNEWKEDLMIQQVSSDIFNGLVHKGFLTIYTSIRDGLLNGLRILSSDPVSYSHLYIGGHSLGGTCAQFLLQDPLFEHNIPTSIIIKQVHLFGTPRIGNTTFAESQVNQKIFRFVNETDIITYLPPPVSPNFIGDKNDVFIYQNMEQKVISFNDNRSSYEENHSLKMYLYFLTSQ